MKAISRWGVAVIVFGLLPNFFLPFTFERFEYPKLILVFFTSAFLLFTWSIQLLRSKESSGKLRLYIVDLFVVFYLCWSLISTLFATSPWAAVFGVWDYQQGGVVFLLCSLVIYWYFHEWTINQKQLKGLLIICLIGVGVALAGSFLDRTGPFFQGLTIRARSTQGHPILLASFLMIGVSITLSLLLTVKKVWVKICLFAFLATILTGIILSLTRSVWIALSLTLSAYLILLRQQQTRLLWKKHKLEQKKLITKRFIAFFASLLIVFILLFWPLFTSRLTLTFSEPASYNSVSKRLIEYQTALRIIKDHFLLGIGPANTMYVYPQYRSEQLNKNDKEWHMDVLQIRSYYLETAATIGVSGLLAFISIIFLVKLGFYQSFLRLQEKETGLLLLGVFGGFLALSIHFLFYGITVTAQILFWSFLGILVAGIKNKSVPVRKLQVNFSVAQVKLAAILLLTAGGLLVWGAYRDITSNISFKARYLNQAVDLSPWRMEYRKELAFKGMQAVNPLLNNKIGYRQKIDDLMQGAKINLDLVEKIDPKDPELAHYKAIWFYQKFRLLKNTDLEAEGFLQALAAAQKAIQLDPTDPRVVDLRTLVYLEKGGEALSLGADSARETIELRYNYSPGHYHLGEALKQLGKFDEAIRAYQEVFNYDTKDSFAAQEIERIEKLSQNLN